MRTMVMAVLTIAGPLPSYAYCDDAYYGYPMLTATLAGRHPACNLRVQPATLSVPGTLQSQACIQPTDEWYTVFALLNVAVRTEAAF